MLWFLYILVFCAVASYVALWLSELRSKQLRAVTEHAMEPSALLKLFRKFGGLPSFITDPEMGEKSGLAWLNNAMSVAWSHIDRAASAWAFEDCHLERLMNAENFWKPTFMQNTGVILQSLTLGQVPAKISGIKCHPPGRIDVVPDELIMDVDFEWASKMQVQIQMRALSGPSTAVDKALKLVFSTLAVKVVIRDVVARGRVRITIKPLMDVLPVAGAVNVCLLDPPHLSYQISSFGANAMMLPGLESWLESFIRNQVLQPFTFPAGITINVAELFGVALPSDALVRRPEGVLFVKILSASNVPRMDFFGLSDPYVKVYLSEKLKQRTTVKAHTLHPSWNEEFTYVVHSTEHQHLHLELWDSDVLRPDDQISSAVLKLGNLDLTTPGKVNHLEVAMERVGTKQYRHKHISNVSHDVPDTTVHGSNAAEESGSVTAIALTNAVKRSFGAPTGPVKLSVDVRFVPFSALESEQTQQGGSMSQIGMRVRNVIEGGMLAIHFTRAFDLVSNRGSIARRFKIKVRVGVPPADDNGGHEHWEYKKVAERSGLKQRQWTQAKEPIFDMDYNQFINGAVARNPHSVIRIEIWVVRGLRKDLFKGAVVIPLVQVVSKSRVRDVWQLEGVSSGRIEMELEWLSALTKM